MHLIPRFGLDLVFFIMTLPNNVQFCIQVNVKELALKF